MKTSMGHGLPFASPGTMLPQQAARIAVERTIALADQPLSTRNIVVIPRWHNQVIADVMKTLHKSARIEAALTRLGDVLSNRAFGTTDKPGPLRLKRWLKSLS